MSTMHVKSRTCLAFWATLLTTGWLSLDATPAHAQNRLRILASYDATREPEPLARIALRPNAKQPVFFYVDNPSDEDRKDLAVKLMKIKPDRTTEEIANGKLTVARKSRARITLAATASQAPPPAPA